MMSAVFLDRDGTINVDKGYLYKKEEFEYQADVIDALKGLQELGYLLVIITNQSGIARGLYTENDYSMLMEWLVSDLRKKGVDIAKHYYCPHLPDGIVKRYAITCNCRKPHTGMYHRAAAELGIDLNKSVVIGDKERDLAICKESGAMGILLSNDKVKLEKYFVCSKWLEILDLIKKINRK